jgi:hypothetical protein
MTVEGDSFLDFPPSKIKSTESSNCSTTSFTDPDGFLPDKLALVVVTGNKFASSIQILLFGILIPIFPPPAVKRFDIYSFFLKIIVNGPGRISFIKSILVLSK